MLTALFWPVWFEYFLSGLCFILILNPPVSLDSWGTRVMHDALNLFHPFWLDPSSPLSLVIPSSLHLNSFCTLCPSIIHRGYRRSHSRLFLLSFLFPPPCFAPHFPSRMNEPQKLLSLLCHPSHHHIALLPSHFNSPCPLILLSSFPCTTLRPSAFIPLFSTPLLCSHP